MPQEYNALVEALHMRNWYGFAALVLTLSIQFIRKNPNWPLIVRVKTWWYQTPDGYRWLWPTMSGSIVAFVGAANSGLPFQQALIAAAGGALGIGVGSMGINALLTELPLPWNGRAGGKPTGLKLDVVVTSNRDPSQIARAVVSELTKLRRRPVAFTLSAMLFVLGCGGAAPLTPKDAATIGLATAPTLCTLGLSRIENPPPAAAILRWCGDPKNLDPWIDLAMKAHDLATEQRSLFESPKVEAAPEPAPAPAPIPDPPPPPPSEPAIVPRAANEA